MLKSKLINSVDIFIMSSSLLFICDINRYVESFLLRKLLVVSVVIHVDIDQIGDFFV